MRRPISNQEPVKRFADGVALQTFAIWHGDARTGNRHAKRYIAAFERLRERGDEGRDALMVLLEHERPDVRVAAAAFLLRHCTEESLKVLRAAAAGESLVAFEAGQAIKRWEEGSWAIDPE